MCKSGLDDIFCLQNINFYRLDNSIFEVQNKTG